MDPEKPAPPPRKLKFAPKPQNRRRATKSTATPKAEKEEDDAETQAAQQQLLQRFNELGNRRRLRPKVETTSTSPAQATFIHGTKQSTATKDADGPQDGVNKQSSELDLMQLDDIFEQSWISSSSVAGPSGIKKDSKDDSGLKIKEYREPWDYAHTYYPTTVPWRRPYSGDPDVLDEAEFGEAATKVEYDERKINPASELGFLNPGGKCESDRLLFLQLPQQLPVIKRSASAKGKEIEVSSPPSTQKGSMALTQRVPSSRSGTSQQSTSLEELSAGHMGKLLVYKSGLVKLKLGNTLLNVSPGSDCTFAQELVAISTKKGECCAIGEIDKRASVVPDVDYLLNSVIDLG